MKKILILVSLFTLIFVINCNGQPKTTYQVANRDGAGNIVPVPGASSYIFFLEKKHTGQYVLVDGSDYLSPDVTSVQIGVSTSPAFDVILDNDGSEYASGMVAVDSQGFYGQLGVGIDNVSVVPSKPGGVGLRKK